MTDAGVLVIDRATAGSLDGSHHAAICEDRTWGIGVADEAPTGNVLESWGQTNVITSADRDHCCPSVGICCCQAERARATHGVARQVNSLRIDLVVLLDLVENRDRALSVLCVGFPSPVLRLRKDRDEGKAPIAFANGCSQAAFYLGVAISARLTEAVQEQDCRKQFVAIVVVWNEDDVFGPRPIGRSIHFVDEAVVRGLVSVFSRCAANHGRCYASDSNNWTEHEITFGVGNHRRIAVLFASSDLNEFIDHLIHDFMRR